MPPFQGSSFQDDLTQAFAGYGFGLGYLIAPLWG